jgi:hypothetical protein
LVEVLDQLDADSDGAVLTLLAQAIARLPGGEAYQLSRELLRGALEQAREGVHELAALSDPDAFDASTLKDLEAQRRVGQGHSGQLGANRRGQADRGVLALATCFAGQQPLTLLEFGDLNVQGGEP